MTFSIDQDYNGYPYKVLIRARTQAQFERVVAILACEISVMAVSTMVSKALAPVATQTIAQATISERNKEEGQEVSANQVMSALSVLADFDEYCGNGIFPWRWPIPHFKQEFRPEPVPWIQKPSPDPWKPDPTPWIDSGLLDVVVLNVVKDLAQMVPESCGALAEASHSLLKKLAG